MATFPNTSPSQASKTPPPGAKPESACCGREKHASCCAPSEKADCCESSKAKATGGGCGCQ